MVVMSKKKVGCSVCIPARAGYVRALSNGRIQWSPCACNHDALERVCDSCSLCVARRQVATEIAS